jgi:CubicO group peptidase (beta-lactamase class C family)
MRAVAVDQLEAALDAVTPDVEAYLADRHEANLLVGVTHQGVRACRAFRSPDAQLAALPSADSVFEIGSVSKVFNAALLGVLEGRGLLSLDDTIGSFLPQLSLAPEIAEITVFDLATHTSGLSGNGVVLARLVDEAVATGDPAKFTYYADYTKAHLDEELRVAELVRPGGTGWEYSRTGLSMLGHILEVAAGEPYEPLVKRHICQPLGLTDTTYTLTPEQESRFVRGYDEDGTPSPIWYWDIMLPQGGLRSTMADMLTFVEANLADDGSPLTADLRRAQETEFAWPEGSTPAPAPYGSSAQFRQALGWWNLDSGHGPVTQHAGGTMSYQSFGALHRKTGTGLVALTSSAANLADIVNFPQLAQRLVDAAVEDAL